MKHSYWNLDDGNGNSIFEGISNEIEARRAAQRIANERNQSVWLYEAGRSDGGEGEPDTEIESEEISPEGSPDSPDEQAADYALDHREGA